MLIDLGYKLVEFIGVICVWPKTSKGITNMLWLQTSMIIQTSKSRTQGLQKKIWVKNTKIAMFYTPCPKVAKAQVAYA